jgi:L-ascorbate metabolism protein UlaG (beta-lactamase superfamily)
MFEYQGVILRWTGHAGFQIVLGNKVIYIDPFKLSKQYTDKQDADLILISHNHFDHLSLDDLRKIVNQNTVIFAAKECIDQLKVLTVKEIRGVGPGEKMNFENVPIEMVAAYNTNKDFHPKKDGKVGFVITISNIRIYHTGDTDIIPEMANVNPDIALTPVSGTYVMTAEEAASVVNNTIRPRIAIPMHYNSIVGTTEDAVRFSEMVTVCPTKILDQQ